ncbi:hypothetical protein HB364_14045 [Pseudoflavitalea sp. X16]|uniref:hypothetical protein n=1 Tax=Paraflavitalea devenefica TaxID=2716334 RepID=UPI001420B010|nr:hypothetical protein [Paraflavitalea devenefica]NII26211.1 hypothetical protein [Paraflavitalea devenefica]
MKHACIIFQKVTGEGITTAYYTYTLNAPFVKEVRYTFPDHTQMLVTDSSGRDKFLGEIWTNNRKLGREVIGKMDNVESEEKSNLILDNIEGLIKNGKMLHPFSILNQVNYDEISGKMIFPDNPTDN